MTPAGHGVWLPLWPGDRGSPVFWSLNDYGLYHVHTHIYILYLHTLYIYIHIPDISLIYQGYILDTSLIYQGYILDMYIYIYMYYIYIFIHVWQVKWLNG